MSTTGYQRERIEKAAKFEKDFASYVGRFRNELYREVAAYLAANIKPGQDGRIRLTVANVRTANGVFGSLRSVTQRRGTQLIRWLVRRLSELFRINSNYFRSLMDYPRSRDEKAIRLLLLRLGYDNQRARVITGGFLSRVFSLEGVAASIARDIQQALTARLTMAAFRKLFRDRFLQAKYVERWFRQFTGDLFHQFDASAQEVMSEELGLKHFVYAGTAIRTTRCFCERRINRIYTKSYAEQWNDLNWKGKIQGGNFFIDRGGYNCRHHLSYVTDRRAERVSKQRGFEINSYNQIECDE